MEDKRDRAAHTPGPWKMDPLTVTRTAWRNVKPPRGYFWPSGDNAIAACRHEAESWHCDDWTSDAMRITETRAMERARKSPNTQWLADKRRGYWRVSFKFEVTK